MAKKVFMAGFDQCICLPDPCQERLALPRHSPATTNAAFCLNGAVMTWMIVAMVLMNWTVPLKSLPPVLLTILHAITTGVSINRYCAMVTMTVEMAQMNITAVSPFSVLFPPLLLLLHQILHLLPCKHTCVNLL